MAAYDAESTSGLRAPDDAIPPFWDYNPSTWGQRLPIVGLAVVGFLIAGYMSLYQFGLIDDVWDPFFGQGVNRVLDSKLSKAFPIPDAALGAFGYLLDAVTGAIGGTKRWKKMPWIVIVFGLAVGPLGAVSIGLVMSQPLVVGAWCTPCLATAVISVLMIGPAMDEFLASCQHVKREVVRGRSGWRAFWGLSPKRPVAPRFRDSAHEIARDDDRDALPSN